MEGGTDTPAPLLSPALCPSWGYMDTGEGTRRATGGKKKEGEQGLDSLEKYDILYVWRLQLSKVKMLESS